MLYDIKDSSRVSLAEHFQVRLEPINGAPRATRLFLRYLGNLKKPSFRGTVRLAKSKGQAPVVSVSFYGFNKKR